MIEPAGSRGASPRAVGAAVEPDVPPPGRRYGVVARATAAARRPGKTGGYNRLLAVDRVTEAGVPPAEGGVGELVAVCVARAKRARAAIEVS